MDNAAAELQRRRELAKLSQRAFRSRQANTLRDLREENARLKAVIKDVVDVAGNREQPALRSAIGRAAKVAGITSDILDNSATSPDITSAVDALIFQSPHTNISSGFVQQQELITGPADADPVVSHDLAPQSSGFMSFRLNCGLFGALTGPERIIEPPLDIMPYLGPNMHTLAGQIYWKCTELGLNLLYRLAGPQPSRIAFVAKHHPYFARLLRYVSSCCSVYYIVALAEARLEFYHAGYGNASDPAATKDSSVLLRRDVEREYIATKEDLEEWIGPSRVEQAVRGMLQGQELGRLEAAIRNDGTALGTRKVLDDFIRRLWLSATCFGDGPRWKKSWVRTLLEWLAGALSICTLDEYIL